MTENFEEFAKTAAAMSVTPSLVFDSVAEEAQLPVEEPKQEVLDDSMLNDEEKRW